MSGVEVEAHARNSNHAPNGSVDGDDRRSATPPGQNPGAGAPSSNLQAADVAMDTSTPTKDINDLLNPPLNIAAMRQRLFDVQGKIELKLDEFETYWPFIDNVWVRQHRAGTDKTGRVTTDYYACRLQRPTYTPRNSDKASPNNPDGKPLRKKQIREGGTCQMRIKTVRVVGGYSGYIITRIGEQEHHTHDLDHMDKIKRNRVIMEIARAEVMKGFMPASVFTIMSEDQEKLAAAGGRHLNRNDVRNASQAWRQNHNGELAVHSGYKYDHGNGIVRDIDEAALRAVALTEDVSIIDPTISGRQASRPPLAITGPPAVPLGALRFPMAARHFLEPYLLPMNSPVVEGRLPFVTLTYASSMDSFLAIAPGKQTLISGPESKAMTHYLRSRHDAILVGVGTALADDPGLNCRLEGAGGYGGMGWDFQPRPVIIDPSARWVLRPNSRILKTVQDGKGRGPWIIMSPDIQMDPNRLEMLKYFGGKYLGLQDMDMQYRLRWEAIFRALAAEGIRSVMVEGGATVINELLQPKYAKLINSVIITVAPTYLGTGGVSVCPTRPTDPTGQPKPVTRFQDVRWQPLGEDVVMCGRLKS